MYPSDRTDNNQGIEVGREAPAALADISSQMPWNITASAQGSRLASSVVRGLGFPLSVGGFPSSAGGPSSVPRVEGGPMGALSRRSSRRTSASPLLGRGEERLSSLELPEHGDETDFLGGPFASDGPGGDSDGFELFGPGADVDIQTAASSRWIRASLDKESSNFLEFVKARLDAEPSPDDDNEEGREGGIPKNTTVEFEELLPPALHTKMVAAQAIHHVLALATKNILNIQQTEGYGPIVLSLAAGV